MRFQNLLLVAFFIISSITTFAQQEPQVVEDEQGSFYIHLVEKGQTLYAISKKYAVEVSAITLANPEIEGNGIKIGQTLRIPVEQVNKKELKKSEVTIVGDTIIHKVVKKETLYSLAKKYELSVEELTAINPSVQEGLKIGTELKIPTSSTQEPQKEEFVLAREDSLQFHIVEPKETMYSLSKLYNISIDSLQLINGGLPDGLKIGAAIRVPKQNPKYELEKQVEKQVADSLAEENWMQTEPFKIGVFLPFYLSKADTADTTVNVSRHASGVYRQSTIALDFYAGTQIAIDSLKQQGLWADIHYFDTENNSDSVRALMAADSMHTFDLFVGPLYKSHFMYVSKFANQFNIPIVSPVKISSKVLLDQPSAVKLYPNEVAHVKAIANYAVNHFADSNLLFLNPGRFNEHDKAELFKKFANQELAKLEKDSILEVSIYTISRSKVLQQVKDSTHYTVAMVSENQAYVSELMTILNDIALSKRGITFTLIGPEKWADFDNIESTYWMNLHVYVTSSTYIDYDLQGTKQFISSFRHQYHTDPQRFAFTGFDATYFAMNQLKDYGPYWLKHVEENKLEGLSQKLDFIQVGAESGFENQGVYIYTIQDYRKIRVQ